LKLGLFQTLLPISGGLIPSSLVTLGPSQPPTLQAFYTSMYLEVIVVLHYNNNDGDIHACFSKACISSK